MKKILVTGASGFIGKHALPKLAALGFEVHTISRSQSIETGAAINHHPFDLLKNRADLPALLNTIKPTHLLHLAWTVEPGKFWSAEDNHDWLAASLQLYNAFVAAGGKRITCAGTCAEYDWNDLSADTILHETNSPQNPATLYGKSKLSLFKTLTDNAARDGISMAWGRIFFLYGPGEKSGRLISDAINNLQNGKEFETTIGTQIRDFMHVEDVAAAFAALCDSNAEGAFNIASGKPKALADILKEIETQTGKSRLLKLGARPMPENEPPAILADITRLKNEINFTPRFSIKTGIVDTISAS